MNKIASNVRHCLVCLRYGIGDLVSELQVLDRLRADRPDLRITALGARPATELLEDYRCVDAVRSVQDWGITHLGHWVDENRTGEIRRWFEQENFDLLLDVSHSPQVIHRVTAEVPARVLEMERAVQYRCIGSGTDGITAINESARAGWGLPIEGNPRPRITLREEERQFARVFLREAFARPGPVVSASPCASSPLKQWPTDRYIGLIDGLIDRWDARVLFFTGPDDPFTGRRVGEALVRPERFRLIEGLHLRKVAALLDRCRLFIGNDSGLMHIAGAVGTPVLAFFGPTSPRIYLPAQVPATALQYPRPCPYRKIDYFGHSLCVLENRCLSGMECIQSICLESAVQAAGRFLQRKESHEQPNPQPAVESRGTGN